MKKELAETSEFVKKIIDKLDIETGESEQWPHVAPSTYREINTKFVEHMRDLRRKLEERFSRIEENRGEVQNDYLNKLYHRVLSARHGSAVKASEDFKELKLKAMEAWNYRTLGLYFDISTNTVLEFFKREYFQKENLRLDSAIYQGRPPLKLQYDQHYCTEDTILRRIKLILRDFTAPDTRVLFLGDDDLGSVTLRSLAPFQAYVIDIDQDVINFIKSKKLDIKCLTLDLNKEIPKELQDHFDAVMFDPYWDIAGGEMFLRAAAKCIKKDRRSRVYLSTYPIFFEEDYFDFQKTALDLGLYFHEILKYFNWYDLKLVRQKLMYNLLKKINEETMKDELFELVYHIPFAPSHMHVLAPACF